VKAVVASQSAQGGWLVHAHACSAHDPPDARATGEAEQNPHSWWAALVRAVRTLSEETDLDAVEAIGLSGQMQSVILVDATGAAVRPALLYSDTRATAEAAELEARLGLQRLQAETLNWKGAASVLPKLLWLSRHEPAALVAATAVHLAAHDYLFARLAAPAAKAGGGAASGGAASGGAASGGAASGGMHVTDATNASTTGLLLASGGGWAEALMLDAGLSERLLGLLPALCEQPGAPGGVAPLSAAAARELGVPQLAGVPVCHGSGDLGATTVGALGSGTFINGGGGSGGGGGATYCYLGTSGWVATACMNAAGGRCRAAPRAFRLRHPSPAASILAAPMTTAGGNLHWLAALLFGEATPAAQALAALDAEAAAAPPGCGGLLFLPYLCGERCPVADPAARACFVGLGRGSSRPHMCRAVLEGLCFAVRSLLPLLEEEGAEEEGAEVAPAPLDLEALAAAIADARHSGRARYRYLPSAAPPPCGPPPLTLVGGVARSLLLPQILADVLQRAVHVPAHPEHASALGAAALGAAALGAAALGHLAVVAPPPPERVYAPCASLAPMYDHAYAAFCRVHPALRDTFAHLACPPPPAPPTPTPAANASSAASQDPRLNQRSTMDWLEAASHA